MNRLATLAFGATLLLGTGAAQAAGDVEAGAKISEKLCASCHGKDGNSAAPTFPRLAGQYADYIVRALLDYESGERTNPVMAANLQQNPLSRQDMEDVAAFFEAQAGSLYTIEYEN